MLAIVFVLFTISLVHVLVGVRYPFVVVLNIAVLQSTVCYAIYSYQFLKNKPHYNLWNFLALSSFGIYHWLLSLRYFRSSLEMDYVLNNMQIPQRNKFHDAGI